MKKTLFIALLVGVIGLTAAGCRRRYQQPYLYHPYEGQPGYGQNPSRSPAPAGKPSAQPAGQPSGSGPAVTTQTFDCTAAACPQVVVSGDPEATFPNGTPSSFRGYADPTMRKDPASGRLWLAYSWPNVHVVAPKVNVPGVDIHLAHSDNGGKTWSYDGPLWPSSPDTNKGGDGGPGYTDHEVANILPAQTSNGLVWYGIHMDYFLPNVGGYKTRPVNSFRFEITRASTVQGLSTSPSQTLGTYNTSPAWGLDINLASLSPQLKNCGIWNESALYYEENTLYLSTRCLIYSGKTPDLANSNLEIFSTSAQGDVKNWQWKYLGSLAGGQVASELGSAGVTQIELAKGTDGKLLAIMTPDDYSTAINDYVHHGCVAVEISSINPPTLARDSSGKLKVRAKITASDQGPSGPGACTYDPASATGIVLVRRDKSGSAFTTTMNQTGVKP